MTPQDQIYIDSVREQIGSGLYDKLFADRTGLVFLDIGANIGLVSIYAVPYCKRIVAIEPAPSTFDTLKRNTKDYPIIECVCAALTPVSGEHEFFVNDINFTASSTVNTYGQRIIVEGQTLMAILDSNNLGHIDICKVDAEGAEGESIGLDQLYACRSLIDTYFIECHNDPKTTWEHKLGTIAGNLARVGYHKMSIDGMAITASK